MEKLNKLNIKFNFDIDRQNTFTVHKWMINTKHNIELKGGDISYYYLGKDVLLNDAVIFLSKIEKTDKKVFRFLLITEEIPLELGGQKYIRKDFYEKIQITKV